MNFERRDEWRRGAEGRGEGKRGGTRDEGWKDDGRGKTRGGEGRGKKRTDEGKRGETRGETREGERRGETRGRLKANEEEKVNYVITDETNILKSNYYDHYKLYYIHLFTCYIYMCVYLYRCIKCVSVMP